MLCVLASICVIQKRVFLLSRLGKIPADQAAAPRMKRTATELLHILVGQIFVLFLASNLLGRTEALGPFLPKPFERGWKPEDYGYTFVPRNHTLTRRTNGEIPDHFGDEMPGIRDHVKNLLPVKRSRIVGNGKKRSLDAAEVLYPSSVQFMFWSDDPCK